jgi:hypothetical protein
MNTNTPESPLPANLKPALMKAAEAAINLPPLREVLDLKIALSNRLLKATHGPNFDKHPRYERLQARKGELITDRNRIKAQLNDAIAPIFDHYAALGTEGADLAEIETFLGL